MRREEERTPSLPSPRAARVRQLFDAAVDLSGVEQKALLDQACAGDAALRAEVDALLRAAAADAPVAAAPHPPAPTELRIPGYAIIRAIGEGATSTVYEAEHLASGRRHAIKLLKSGFVSSERRRRFEHEITTLISLKHGNIAGLLAPISVDAGDRAGPRPGFAMELVIGRDLVSHAAERRLTDAQRLELLAVVVRAVAYAHSKRVVHRDLKPQNILVTDDGTPKILDFGVARTLASDDGGSAGPDATMHTLTGDIVGTFTYMSPEQARGQSKDVDARADIYSLGVILFELLTGRLPYPIQGRSPLEAMRIIDQVPALSLGAVRPDLRGEAEVVVAKALEKEPARRYQTADEFADDLERLARRERISARAPSAAYRLWSFVRRRRAIMLGALAPIAALGIAAVGVATIGGTLTTMIALALAIAAIVVAADRTVRIQAERSKVRAAAAALEEQRWDIFEAGNLWLNHLDQAVLQQIGDDRSVPFNAARAIDEAILSPGLAALERDHALNAELSTSVRNAAGSAYRNLGLFERAEEQLQRVLSTRRSDPASHPGDVASAEANLAMLYLRWSRPADAAGRLVAATDGMRPIAERKWRLELAAILTLLGRVRTQLGDHAGAAEAHGEAVALRSDHEGRDSVDFARALAEHAESLSMLERHGEAADAARRSVTVLAERLPARSLYLVGARLALVRILVRAEAGFGAESLAVLRAIEPVAQDLAAAGEPGRALFEEFSRLRGEAFGDQPPPPGNGRAA